MVSAGKEHCSKHCSSSKMVGELMMDDECINGAGKENLS